jgi:hypothetical protein
MLDIDEDPKVAAFVLNYLQEKDVHVILAIMD